MVYRLLSEWCVVTSFYQRPASHVYYYAVLNLRNLLYFINANDLLVFLGNGKRIIMDAF